MKQTLASFTITPVNGNGAATKARLAADVPFQASTGGLHLAGDAEQNYTEITLTVDGDELTFPTTVVDSTTDSDDPNATYSLYLVNSRGKQVGTLFERWSFDASLGTTIQYQDLAARNQFKVPLRDDEVYTKTQTDIRIASALNVGNPATVDDLGRVKVDTAPDDAASPVAVSVTSPLVGIISTRYASLSAAITAIGSTPTTLTIVNSFPSGGTCTVPATLRLKFASGGSLNISNGHIVTILSDAGDWPIGKIFNNALAGQGTVRLWKNNLISEIYIEWWGGRADAPAGGAGTDNLGPYNAAQAAMSPTNFPTSPLDSDLARGKLIRLLAGRYYSSGSWRVERPLILSGQGGGGTGYLFGSGTEIVFPQGVTGIQVENESTSSDFVGLGVSSIIEKLRVKSLSATPKTGTGTISFTAGNAIATGSGTTFGTDVKAWQVIETQAQNGTGTISTTAGNPIVTGTGTSFTTEVEDASGTGSVVGAKVVISGVTYHVTGILSDTQMYLSPAPASNVSGQSFTVARRWIVTAVNSATSISVEPLPGKNLSGLTFVIRPDGIRGNGRLVLRDVSVSNFAGNGVYQGSLGTPPTGFLNGNLFDMQTVRSQNNGGTGFRVDGSNAQAGVGFNLDANTNGEFGFWDTAGYVNTWIACHAEGNLYAPVHTSPVPVNHSSSWIGLYVEGGQPAVEIYRPAVVWPAFIGVPILGNPVILSMSGTSGTAEISNLTALRLIATGGADPATFDQEGVNSGGIPMPSLSAVGHSRQVFDLSVSRQKLSQSGGAYYIVLTENDFNAWTSFTPTVSAASGTFTSVSATGKYKQIGKTVFVRMAITITSHGSASSALISSVPVSAPDDFNQVMTGYDSLTQKGVRGVIVKNTTQLSVTLADGTSPIADGTVIHLEGSYERA
jgi:hypothetical protein